MRNVSQAREKEKRSRRKKGAEKRKNTQDVQSHQEKKSISCGFSKKNFSGFKPFFGFLELELRKTPIDKPEKGNFSPVSIYYNTSGRILQGKSANIFTILFQPNIFMYMQLCKLTYIFKKLLCRFHKILYA